MPEPTKPPEGMTTHDLLLEVRRDVKSNVRRLEDINGKVDIIISQNLDHRLNDIERWRHRVDGRVSVLTVGIGFVGVGVAVLNFL
jgi:hypothetical protein